MVVDALKKRFGPCEPIVLSDMKWMKQNSGALRQAFKRMSDKGIVKRYMNGVYYFPDKGRTPSVETVLCRMYVEGDETVYGYYAGYAFGRRLKVTRKKDECPIIVTNKENSRGRYRVVADEKVYLRKPYTDITKDNVETVALLDFIREWELYSDLNEEDTFLRIKKYIKKHCINQEFMMELAVFFPHKVSTMILKYKLMQA